MAELKPMPAGVKMVSNLRIYPELCKGMEGCGICISICRKDVFEPGATLNRKGYRPPKIAQPESCTSCKDCMIFCPDLAIAVAGKSLEGRVKK